jgi:asparagine synthase (glutamine-hydrolysing)
MAHSREVRLPFLNHDLVDFLFTLPSSFKIKDGWTKWIMRESTSHILPENICWRKDKIGYEPPQKNWMENEKIKQKIAHNRQVLFDHNIINKSVLTRSIEAEESNKNNGNNWQMWVAGNLY